jgi:outer membrane protein OmpU
MKHILLATTALVATAGIASADVAISGYAEIGVADRNSGNLEFFQDIDVRFDMSGETDGGVSFTANIDLDQAPAGVDSPWDHGGGTIGVSGGFGNVTMGGTDGAYDWALTETAMSGSMADNETAHTGYDGNGEYEGGDGQVLRWDYSAGSLGVAVSMTQGDNGAGVEDDTIQAGVRYSMDMGGNAVNMGVSFSDGDDLQGYDGVGVSLAMGLGSLNTVLNYSDGEKGGDDVQHMGIGIGFTQGPLSVGANYGEREKGTASTDGFGLAVAYALGGGATFRVGYSSDSGNGLDTPATDDTMSMGLALSF